MNAQPNSPASDAFRPLLDQLKTEIRAELMPVLLAELRSDAVAKSVIPKKRTLSIREIGRIYTAGRKQVKDDIAAGRLQAIERRCRGGRIGIFVPVEACEKLYAGVRP